MLRAIRYREAPYFLLLQQFACILCSTVFLRVVGGSAPEVLRGQRPVSTSTATHHHDSGHETSGLPLLQVRSLRLDSWGFTHFEANPVVNSSELHRHPRSMLSLMKTSLDNWGSVNAHVAGEPPFKPLDHLTWGPRDTEKLMSMGMMACVVIALLLLLTCLCYYESCLTMKAAQPTQYDMVRIDAPGEIRTHAEEGKAINHLLDLGKLVCFTFEKHAGRERFQYTVHDAKDLALSPRRIRGASSTLTPKPATSFSETFSTFRSKLSVRSDEDEWTAAVTKLMHCQVHRYMSLLSLLDLKHSENPVIAVLRLHDDPTEYAQPVKLGDVVIVWSPHKDGGTFTHDDRVLTSPIVVNMLTSFLDRNRSLSQINYRTDADGTEQGDKYSLDYRFVFRKLFQKAIVR